MMTTLPEDASRKERKPIHNASAKVSLVVHKMLVPLISYPIGPRVNLDGDGDGDDMADFIRQAHPESVLTRDSLLHLVESLYDPGPESEA